MRMQKRYFSCKSVFQNDHKKKPKNNTHIYIYICVCVCVCVYIFYQQVRQIPERPIDMNCYQVSYTFLGHKSKIVHCQGQYGYAEGGSLHLRSKMQIFVQRMGWQYDRQRSREVNAHRSGLRIQTCLEWTGMYVGTYPTSQASFRFERILKQRNSHLNRIKNAIFFYIILIGILS